MNACINFYPPVGKLVFWLTPKTVFQQAIAHHEMSVDKVDRRLSKGTKRKDLISYVLKAKDEKGMLRLELDSTAAALILAGAEGVSSSLTATTNHLLRHPGKLQKLAHEIRSTFKEEAEMTAPSLESLPYLKAVILEGFRFTAPVPIGIPRIVPPEDAIVAGQVLPGNVCNSTLNARRQKQGDRRSSLSRRPSSASRNSPHIAPQATSLSQTRTFQNGGCQKVAPFSRLRQRIRHSRARHLQTTIGKCFSLSPLDHATALVRGWR